MRARSLFTHLLAAQLIIAIGALGGLGIALDRLFERRALDDLRTRLESETRVVREAVDRERGADLAAAARALGAASGVRITLIRADGLVIADSERAASALENHSDRAEVRAALEGRVGVDQRRSESVGRPFLYVALPVRAGVIVRGAVDATEVAARRSDVRSTVAIAFAVFALLAAGVSALLARTLARPLARITLEVERVARGTFTSVEPAGPTEARALATAVNRMAEELAGRVEEIRRETGLREQILSSMEEGVILAEGDEVVYTNRCARDLFGSRDITRIPPQISIPDGANPVTAEFVVHHPQYREIRYVAVALGTGKTLIVAQDVTDAKRLDRVRRDFVANASHELKTPVAAILATAETLPDALHGDPGSAARFVAALAREARTLSNLVEDLLDLTRLEQASQDAQPVDLTSVVRGVVEELRERAGARALGTAIEDDVRVPGRPEDLALMTRNLLDNAIRYTPEGGSIDVALQADGGQARLEVRDTGIGIPQKDLPRIFERFYRVDRARSRETGGTGLGLSLVRHVVEAHGGTVTASSELGAGSVFTVSLPLDG